MKKILAIALMLTFILAFASCAKLPEDPVDLGKKLVKEYGDDVEIYIMMGEDSIQYIAKTFDIDDDGVYAVVEVETSDDGIAYVIYCEKTSQAKDVEKDCEDALEKFEDDADDYVVKRNGKVVFIGHEDILDKL